MSKADITATQVLAGRDWERRGRDLPDLIGSKDYFSFPEATADLVSERLRARAPRTVEVVPYPKTGGGLRHFVHGSPVDEIALRHLTEPVARVTDRRLSDDVLTYRVRTKAKGLRCRRSHRAIVQRREKTSAFILGPEFEGLGIADVRSYYGSVHRPTLMELLHSCCDGAEAVERLGEWLETLMGRSGLPGIPIGPEPSGVLANAYLLPLDNELIELGIDFFRVTDDYWMHIRAPGQWSVATSMARLVLGALELEAAESKTRLVTDQLEALQLVRSGRLSAVESAFAWGSELGRERVHELVDALALDAELRVAEVRYAINECRRLSDTYALSLLEARPEVMEDEPRCVGDYLVVLGAKKRKLLEPYMNRLTCPIEDREQALVLHLLRAFGHRGWGKVEGDVFEGHALDARLAVLTRGFALIAWSRTPRFSVDVAVDLAISPETPLDVRRGAVLALERAQQDCVRRKALTRCAVSDADLVPTSNYVEAA